MNSKMKTTLKLCFNCELRKPKPVNQPCGNMIPERFRFYEKAFTAVGLFWALLCQEIKKVKLAIWSDVFMSYYSWHPY